MHKHRLTFKLEHLVPVQSGAKRATIRFSAVAARVRLGDALTLAFGRYDAPVLLTAAAARVETVLLEPEMSRCLDLPPDVRTLVDEMAFYRRPVAPNHDTPAALVEALAASGGDFAALLQEAVTRDAQSCTCVWWRDVHRSD